MIKKTRTGIYDFNFHLIWVTKYRKAVFTTSEYRKDMEEIILNIASNNDIEINEIEVLPDHIHLLISFPPKYSASQVVKTLKGGTAIRWFKKHPTTKTLLWGGHLWSPSFFMSTLGEMSKDIVEYYIQKQLTEYNAGRPRH